MESQVPVRGSTIYSHFSFYAEQSHNYATDFAKK